MSLLRSAISAKEVLGFVCRTGLDAPILPWEDSCWEWLRAGSGPSHTGRSALTKVISADRGVGATGPAVPTVSRRGGNNLLAGRPVTE